MFDFSDEIENLDNQSLSYRRGYLSQQETVTYTKGSVDLQSHM